MACYFLFALFGTASASLLVPPLMVSPLGIPGSMGESGMTAVKFAVGSRLLNMLGSVGPGSGGLPRSLLSSQLGSGSLLSALGALDAITPRSKEFSRRRGPNIPTTFDIRTATPTEIENFFAVLDKVDANKCISRLVCEVGARPKTLEGLGHNIKDVMSSLQVLEKNALSLKYRRIMIQGQKIGFDSCLKRFSTCDQKNYRLIRTFIKAFKMKN